MSGITQADVQRLAAPTPADQIKQRPGPARYDHKDACQGKRCPDQRNATKHLQIDYVDARYVMDRLDELGPGNWQDRYEDRSDGTVRCGIGINVEGEWVWKWDVGDPTDIEAAKGVHSDSFKRCGVKWGIARDLYGDHAAAEPAPARQNGSQRPPPPRLAPRPAPTPVAAADDPYADLPNDWDKSLPPVAPAAPAAPMDIRDGAYSDTCPEHHKEWRTNSRGYYCASKTDGDWCKWRPSKRWIAEHETVPA